MHVAGMTQARWLGVANISLKVTKNIIELILLVTEQQNDRKVNICCGKPSMGNIAI